MDLTSIRPKVWKGPGDCMAMVLGGEMSCDLPAGHDGGHYDAEYRVTFEADEVPVPRWQGATASVGLWQVIPHEWPGRKP